MDFTAQLKAHVARVERGFAQLVPAATPRPALLHAPNPGKIFIESRGNEDLRRKLENLGGPA